LHSLVDGVLAADGYDDLVGGVVEAVFLSELLGDGGAELGYARGGGAPNPTISTPWAFSCCARAVTAMVADGGTCWAR